MSLQMFTVEYQVPVAVDGVTPAPPFSFDPASPDFKAADSDGIVRFTAAEMLDLTGGLFGLFDPDFGTGGTFADRFIHMIEVRTSGAGAAAAISVVDARDSALSGQEEILPPAAEADFYTDDCVFVPQGSALGFSGFTPSAGSPVVIRINVVPWGSVEDYATLLNQCCCENLTPSEGGCCPPQVADSAIGMSQGTVETLSLPGCGLEEPMTAEVRTNPLQPPPTGLPTVNTVTVTRGTAPAPDTVDINMDTNTSEGGYMLILTNGCGCCTVSPFSVSAI
jgi:hypothetical protein